MLDTLDLHQNNIGPCLTFSNCFTSLLNLRVLNLSGNGIEEICLDASLPALNELNLRQNKIRVIEILVKFNKLEKLYLSDN